MSSEMILLTTAVPDEARTQVGAFLFASSVCAANVVRDIKENIKNLTGGNLHHYEDLIERSVARAMERLGEKARALGYNGIVNIRISHPAVVDGTVSVTVYGNGCVFVRSQEGETTPGDPGALK